MFFTVTIFCSWLFFLYYFTKRVSTKRINSFNIEYIDSGIV